MSIWNHYHLACSVEDALRVLQSKPGSSRLIAGGSDLLLDLQQGRTAPVDTLVDVTSIPEMTRLEIQGQELFIGAAVPLKQITNSPWVAQHCQALQEAAGLVGGPQVRNIATLGGNVAHALPAADGMIASLALDAQTVVADASGQRRVPLGQLFKGPGKSMLDPNREILVGFYFPLIRAGQASAFSRIMRPQGVALPILNMAVWLQRKDDRIADIRISLGPAGPTPQRGTAAETILKGNPLSSEIREQALKALLESVHLRTSPQRATADYRKHLSGVLLDEVLNHAWQRALSGGQA